MMERQYVLILLLNLMNMKSREYHQKFWVSCLCEQESAIKAVSFVYVLYLG